MNKRQALTKACFLLRKQAKEETLARFLLQYLLEEDTNTFNTNLDEQLNIELENKYFELIENHIINDTPLSHLIGFDYFYDRKFYVTSDVLSPRMETEELVYTVLQYIKKNNLKNTKILDLCTGSGIIGITLKKECPSAEITISDISSTALTIAKKNSFYNDADVRIVQGDLFENINSKFDIIVSNPPYIAYEEEKTLEKNVIEYDPHIALFAKENGMYFYRKIIEQSTDYLTENGVIFFEIGHDQKHKIEKLATNNGYKCEVIKDINGKDRIAYLKNYEPLQNKENKLL